jgi:hypothetical protein
MAYIGTCVKNSQVSQRTFPRARRCRSAVFQVNKVVDKKRARVKRRVQEEEKRHMGVADPLPPTPPKKKLPGGHLLSMPR